MVARDGPKKALEWALRVRDTYASHIDNPRCHISREPYRRSVIASLGALERFIEGPQ